MTVRMTPPFTVQYAYRVSYLPRSCTENRTAYFQSEMELSFRDVPAADAPVAFRLSRTEKETYGRKPFNPLPDGSPKEVRWFEDGFWLEWGDAADMVDLLAGRKPPDRTPFSETIVVSPFEPADDKPRKNSSRTAEKSPQGIQTHASLLAREQTIKWDTDDGGASHADAIREVAAACIVIDGRLYESIPEPCLQLSESWGDIEIACIPDANRTLSFGTLNFGTTTYRLDAFAEAKKIASKARFSRENPLPVIEILRPDLVMADPDGGRCLKGCRKLLKEIGDIARDLPKSWIGKASALGLALRDCPRLPTPALAAALDAIAAAPLPDEAQVARAKRLNERSNRERDVVGTALDALAGLSSLASELSAQARVLSERYDTLPGRLDPSVGTLTKEGKPSEDRLRQARAPEDFRRASRMLGQPMDGLTARLRDDPDLDVVLHESGFQMKPGKDHRLKSVHVVDLSTGEIVESVGDEADPDILSKHLDRAWPGTRPETSHAPGAR